MFVPKKKIGFWNRNVYFIFHTITFFFSSSFQGCVYHGHCLANKDCPLSAGMEATPFKVPFEEVRDSLERKRKDLKELNIDLVEKWECEFLRDKEEDEELQRFLTWYHQRVPPERLALRRGLRGGRTENFRMSFSQETSKGRKMHYWDINSLYPAQVSFPVKTYLLISFLSFFFCYKTVP